MMFRRMVVVFLTVLCLCAGMTVPISADTGGSTVSPAYTLANNVTSELNISGQTAYCTSVASGPGVSTIAVEQTLEKFWGLWIWFGVDGANWTKTVNINTIAASNTKTGLDTGTYRLKSVFTLTNSSGETETITVYSSEVTLS